MLIKTNEPITKDRAKVNREIADFWNQTSLAWKIVWGLHIHHGFYADESLTPIAAQEKLITKLADKLAIKPSQKILDVGCGMGGSSIFLAKNYTSSVLGITLSLKQVELANEEARNQNVSNVVFSIGDALGMGNVRDASFDIVWSLESCEQFCDKNKFLQEAYRVLKPKGKLLLVTWCSDREEYEGKDARKYKNMCDSLGVPYMPTINCYKEFLKKAHFDLLECEDWSQQVKRTWDIGIKLFDDFSIWQLIKMIRWRILNARRQLKMMQDAYREERLRYGVFVAEKN